jgi:PAS domain S-box-containing protein
MAATPRLSPSTILRYERLEGIAERSIEDLVKLTAQLLGVERCFAGFVHPNDGWLRTVVGVTPAEAREHAALCAFAMLQSGPTFAADARKVDMLAHVPLVSSEGGVRLYAGVPIVTMDGVARGALVLIDRKVRALTDTERETFLALAIQVKNQVELNTRIEDLRGKHASQIGALSMLKGLLKAATTFAIIGTDTNGRISLFNEGAERVFGISAQEAGGLTPLTFLDAREVKLLGAQLTATIGRPIQGFNVLVAECEGDAPVEHTWSMRRASGGAFPGLLVAARVVAEDGTLSGYAFIARDITEQRAVDRMKDDFVSMVSHELRTPLTAIRGALGLAAGGVAGRVPEGLGELVHIAHSNTERLLRIVNDILDIHRLESGALELRPEPTDLLAVVNRAVELTSPVASEYGVSFLVAETAQTAMVLVDFERWVQVLVNLLSNAVKYSPAGDTVDIDIERRGRLVRVTVTDRGPGIPEEFRARVFEKFAQASTGNMRLSGTGLGLSIVKLLVEQHGGHVGFDSIRGRGTTFYVDMPLMETR